MSLCNLLEREIRLPEVIERNFDKIISYSAPLTLAGVNDMSETGSIRSLMSVAAWIG